MGILDCFGISKSDFNAQQLSHSNASDAVVDEKIDGYIISGSLGQSHQMKAMASGKCKLADLGSDEEIQNVINRLLTTTNIQFRPVHTQIRNRM